MIFTKNVKATYECLVPRYYGVYGTGKNKCIIKQTTCDGFVRYASLSSAIGKLTDLFGPSGYTVSSDPAEILTPGSSTPATSSVTTRYQGWAFGSGSTAPTETDTTLESPLSTTPSFSIANTWSCKIENGVFTTILRLAITNTGSDSVTFREIGLIRQARGIDLTPTYGNDPVGGSSQNAHQFMLARHVFPSNVTIAAGETIQMKFEFPQQLGSSSDYPDIAEWNI